MSEEKNPWIPVDVELPHNRIQPCLVTRKSGSVLVAWYSALYGWVLSEKTNCITVSDVVAWKRLEVKPYKEPEKRMTDGRRGS